MTIARLGWSTVGKLVVVGHWSQIPERGCYGVPDRGWVPVMWWDTRHRWGWWSTRQEW